MMSPPNRPTSNNWFVAPVGRRPTWERQGAPPPYGVPASLLGYVPGTPAYFEAACAACIQRGRLEAGAIEDEISPLLARMICHANGEIPSTLGQGKLETDIVLAALSAPYCWIDPAVIAAAMAGHENDTGEELGDLLWALVLTACPGAASRGASAYDWNGSSEPPPRLVTLVNTLGAAFKLGILAPPIQFAAFQLRALDVARAALAAGASSTLLGEVIDELGGGSPLRIAREFLERLGVAHDLPDPGEVVTCDVGPPATVFDQRRMVAWNLPASSGTGGPVAAPSGVPVWGWVLGGSALALALGTAIYFGTRGTRKRRRNYGSVDTGLLELDAPLQGTFF